MSSFYDELEQLIARHRETEQAHASQQEIAQRFDRLEAGVTSLADSVSKLVRSPVPVPPDAGGDGDGSGAGGVGDASPAPPPPPPPNYPVERLQTTDVPRIYTGDDEPETVTYIDSDSGEEKTRPGRRKGQPYNWLAEVVPDTGGGDDGGGAAE